MKYIKVIFYTSILMLIVNCGISDEIGQEIKEKPKTKINLVLASFNILSKNKDASNAADFGGEIRYWSNRKQVVANIIMENNFDVVGIQELDRDDMRKDLYEILSSYGFSSDKRQDAICWLKNKFTLIKQGDFLANNGPYSILEPANGSWGKFVTWVRLKENKSGKEFYVFNGHPIHYTDKPIYRSNFAKELLRQEKVINTDNLPVFVTGDFNAYDERGTTEESADYNNIFSKEGYKNGMLAARIKINEKYGTWAGFGKIGEYAWLDRIYFSEKSNANIEVSKYEAFISLDPNRIGFRKEPIPSDHFPICLNLNIEYLN